LVVQMVTQHGYFWEEVQKARKGWEITPVARIPPEVPHFHYPPNEPEVPSRDAVRDPQNLRAKLQERVSVVFRLLWYEYLVRLRNDLVPEAYRRSDPLGHWTKFLSTCLLYDPPRDDLEGFASYADPDLITLATEEDSADSGAGETRDTALLPIKYLPDPDKVKADAERFYKTVINEIGKLLQSKLELAGIKPEQFSIDIWQLYYEAAFNRPDPEDGHGNLQWEYAGKQLENEPRAYIDPSDEEATKENVEAARQLLRQTQPATPNVGRPKIDSLVAVQCAILFYERNHRMPGNRRRWRWTFKNLAEKFGLPSEGSAREHVKLGRALLKKEISVQ
jgi:hypothetical protein